MPRTFTVKRSDIQRCPKHSLLPAHYNDDGSCRCRHYVVVVPHPPAPSQRHVFYDRRQARDFFAEQPKGTTFVIIPAEEEQ